MPESIPKMHNESKATCMKNEEKKVRKYRVLEFIEKSEQRMTQLTVT
jgi:hypothetical protein